MNGLGWLSTPQSGEIGDYKTIGAPVDMVRVAGASSAFALTTATVVNGSLYALPIIAPRRGGTIDVISIGVTTVGSASNVGRIGIYRATSETNPYPAGLVFGSGSLDLTTPAATSLRTATANATLSPGALYWLAFVCSTGTAAVLRGWGAVNGMIPLGIADLTATAPIVGVVVTGQSAGSALPDPFPAGATAMSAVPIPAIGYHFSA